MPLKCSNVCFYRMKMDGRVAAVNTSYVYLWNSSKKHLKYARGYCIDIWSTFLPWHVVLNQNNNKFRANVLCKYLEILNMELNQFYVFVCGTDGFFFISISVLPPNVMEMECNKYAKCENCIGCKSKLRSMGYIAWENSSECWRMKKRTDPNFHATNSKVVHNATVSNWSCILSVLGKTPFCMTTSIHYTQLAQSDCFYSKMRWACKK